MGDDERGVGEHFAAGAVVGMVVAQNQVLDRPAEAFGKLGLEPSGGVRVDPIGGDDARRRDQENRVMKPVLEPVEVAGDLGDASLRRRLRRRRASEGD